MDNILCVPKNIGPEISVKNPYKKVKLSFSLNQVFETLLCMNSALEIFPAF